MNFHLVRYRDGTVLLRSFVIGLFYLRLIEGRMSSMENCKYEENSKRNGV